MPQTSQPSPRVRSLWRYPVKSMAGEALDAAQIIPRGLLGDRLYALVDTRQKVGTARKHKGMLDCSARFLRPPQAGQPAPPVEITLPDGGKVSSEQPDSDAVLSKAFECEVKLQSPSTTAGLMFEFAAGTLGGKHAATTEVPIAGGAPPGTLVDYGTLLILTTSTLERLQQEYPGGRFEICRFRPNIVVESAEPGFAENAWVGHTLAIGDQVRLRVTMPCPRCVIPTLPQGDLPHDPGILRTIVKHNRHDLGDFGNLPCVGVFADVLQPGTIRRGDPLRLLD